MSLAMTYCRAQYGTDAPLVTVETHLSNGLPAFNIVGLAQTAVKESKDRVRSALINSHFEFPQRRITINLAPAELPKQGGRYDLAIAIGILVASNQVPGELLDGLEFLGELSLNGDVRPVRAALPSAVSCHSDGRALIIPSDNQQEASFNVACVIHSARHLLEVCAHLNGARALATVDYVPPPLPKYTHDFQYVQGQTIAKRALCIAASGRHHVLMAGSPGSGKTLLAHCLPSILPPMSIRDAIDTASILSLDSQHTEFTLQRPFCSPHHSASSVALVGGGSPPRPGEISRAHNGVLFLDEMPEFSRHVLETLREPLESGYIVINRAAHKMRFNSRVMLVGAMNLCRCGFYRTSTPCRCSPDQIERYQNKLSGPLLDRIDIQLFIQPVSLTALNSATTDTPMSSAELQANVIRAHQTQLTRQGKSNSDLEQEEIKQHCMLSKDDHDWFINTLDTLSVSMRGYYRMLKVARSIADFDQVEHINRQHVQEALQFRVSLKSRQ
ncbi:MAG: YifB family Mg chelatase-like AAA ATPase [Pseudomonadota bacterium]